MQSNLLREILNALPFCLSTFSLTKGKKLFNQDIRKFVASYRSYHQQAPLLRGAPDRVKGKA
ncbi:hypothetical protein LH29_11895 [Draconibacterium sediminis]|uniref:Uncharacterized protein n=1 Tax=Draconibacterium sediminis TaxID=1544798 RepID=A0A0D8JB91_9BACT|nr:hypothetical protein LH29_11895 [Draconibacterium sediminis]